MEEVLMAAVVALVGGALFRWLRHKTWRICMFAVALVVFAQKSLQLEPFHPERVWQITVLFVLLSMFGAYLIGLVLRSRIAQAAKGSVIVLSKNVDSLAEVARQHDNSTLGK